MKPKFLVCYEGSHDLYCARNYKAEKGETISHECAEWNPWKSKSGEKGFLFSDVNIAIAFSESLNQKIRNTIKKFQKLNKQETKGK